eukprot:CCRYP_012876-RB/>CCRYP_012876-RB protein AED:0.06 eAED:0.06 QI:334/0.8/0.83/1/0.8/0.66/6/506/945
MRAGIISSRVVLLGAVVLWSGRATLVDAKSNLLRAENVFGWRQEKSSTIKHGYRANPRLVNKTKYSEVHSSSSPLKRSENVFGWQQSSKKSQTSDQRRTSRKASPRGNGKSILNTNSSTNDNTAKGMDDANSMSDNLYDENNHRSGSSHPRISPPNIKLQPRKKELWLPWPLGALRNDYYRFAEQQRLQSGYDEQSNHLRQQERLRSYYSDGHDGFHSPTNLFLHGRDWAGRMFQRSQSFVPRRIKQDDTEMKSTPPGFWVKDTTTSMATASATMGRKKQEEEQRKNENRYKKASKQKVTRGGDSEDDGRKRHWDHEMILKYVKLQMKVRLRQLGYVGSDFSVHLPPASPTLLLLYMLPSTQDPLRRLVKISLTGATISWMHSEATKYRRFAPLPTMQGMNVRRPDLLPFLPEEEFVEKVDHQSSVSPDNNRRGVSNNVEIHANNSSHTLWDPFQSFGTISSAYRGWLEGQSIQSRVSHEQRRKQAQTQLLAIRESSMNTTFPTENSYALITGASRGIGRALAVELARYRIPLILVARDISKLTQVANDIETYYNVPCRILQADLSSPDCASRIHAATTEAGLKVDILINNAGVCNQGEMVEGDIDSTMNMVQVNVGSVVQLSHLYGKDMKERRRGRMLFVSSMAGAMPGCASVAVYAATKSFEKSLASSLGREMERYGIGVTCLLPGAVRDTDFASRSSVEDAVCFQVPGYAKSPEMVAGEGVKALMLGYPEVYPGWENRIFAKLGLPFCPPRIAGLIGEYAWSPWQLGIPSKRQMEVKALPSVPNNSWKFRRPSLGSGMLRLPDMPKRQISEAKTDDILFSRSPRDEESIKLNDAHVGVDPIVSESVAQVVPKNTSESASSVASPTSPPNLPLLGIQDRKMPPESSAQQQVGDGLGHPEYDTNKDSGEVDTVIIPKSNETWYPSMLDQKQYDFRDPDSKNKDS